MGVTTYQPNTTMYTSDRHLRNLESNYLRNIKDIVILVLLDSPKTENEVTKHVKVRMKLLNDGDPLNIIKDVTHQIMTDLACLGLLLSYVYYKGNLEPVYRVREEAKKYLEKT